MDPETLERRENLDRDLASIVRRLFDEYSRVNACTHINEQIRDEICWREMKEVRQIDG